MMRQICLRVDAGQDLLSQGQKLRGGIAEKIGERAKLCLHAVVATIDFTNPGNSDAVIAG